MEISAPDIHLGVGSSSHGKMTGEMLARIEEVLVERKPDMRMPEEQNRIVTDHLYSLLFCPTDSAVTNQTKVGITRGVYQVGDIMLCATLHYWCKVEEQLASGGTFLPGLAFGAHIRCIAPVGHFAMLELEIRYSRIITDSGNVQKKGYFSASRASPCATRPSGPRPSRRAETH